MASVFTFDPDPPRVSSPWSTPRTSTPRPPALCASSPSLFPTGLEPIDDDTGHNFIVTSLEAEPQEGPTEYKLHLLLRRRRSFTWTSTGSRIPGSYRTPVMSPHRISDGQSPQHHA